MGKSPALFLETAASLDKELRKGADVLTRQQSSSAGKSYYSCGKTVSQRTPASNTHVAEPPRRHED